MGEAASCDYLQQDAAGSAAALEKMRGYILPDPFCLEETLSTLRGHFPANPAALCAVDVALHDLLCHKLGIPVHSFFGLTAGEARKTGFTVEIDDVADAAAKVEEAGDYSILKVRLGTGHDMEIMRIVREATDAVIRVDADAAWSLDEAVDKMKALADMGVEYVEQPLPRGDVEGHVKLKEHGILPIFLDETVQTSADIPGVAEACDGINIKLTKCGGLREAYRMIAVARAHGLKVLLGCMVQSSVGITAAAHLSPLVDYLDLDGNLLVGNDPYRGVISAFSEMILPDRPGLGLVEAYEAHEFHD
jgi:L-alanine-DL-glutamate epimerase-like enolase superfamily enzyme